MGAVIKEEGEMKRSGPMRLSAMTGISGVVLIGLLIWLIFSPAIMSVDSRHQYGEALRRQYRDGHPPIMAIALSGVLALGGGIKHLMLVQCLAGCGGLYYFAVCCWRFIWKKEGWGKNYLALGVLVLLLTPLSPLCFYLMTFWKDAWQMVLLLWVGALSLQLFESPPRARGRFYLSLGLLMMIMVVSLLTQHQALLLFPSYAALLFFILYRRRGWYALAGALGVIIVYMGINLALYSLFPIQREQIGDRLLGLELVGLCVADERVIEELPFTRDHLVWHRFREQYIPGYVGNLYRGRSRIVKGGYTDGHHREILREYLYALRKYPGMLARVKWRGYKQLLGLERTHNWHHYGLIQNPFGLQPNERFRPVRKVLYGWSEKISRGNWRWLGGVHLVWIIVNLLLLGGGLFIGTFMGKRHFLFGVVLLTVPLIFYFCLLLIGTPSHDFRYLYPATLMVQVVFFSLVLGAGAAYLRKKISRQGLTPSD